MANPFGYMQLFTDRPETWVVDGKVEISDGYGTASYTRVPSGVISSIERNYLGNYSIYLQESWYSLLFVSVISEIDPVANPSASVALSQIEGDTVGDTSYGGPGQDKQSITFSFVDAAGNAMDLPEGSAFRFLILLKRSSA